MKHFPRGGPSFTTPGRKADRSFTMASLQSNRYFYVTTIIRAHHKYVFYEITCVQKSCFSGINFNNAQKQMSRCSKCKFHLKLFLRIQFR